MSFKKIGPWLAFLAAGLLLLSATPSRAGTNVLFILDSSGSMLERVDGVAKVVTAKRVLDDTLAKLSGDTEIGLMTYGHRRRNDCSDIQILDPIGADKAPAIARKVNALAPKGETPIAGALQQSAAAFKNMPGERNIIILITDGAESCKGDPCAAAHALAAANVDLQINVVGFKLAQKERDAVECIAREGRGTYYDASNIKTLTAAMAAVAVQVAAPPPPPPPPPEPNLLGLAEGGQVIAAPGAGWEKVVTGKDKDAAGFSCTAMPFDVIFAFKDERPATFDKFEILIPEAGKFVKDFELLAADDSPIGEYRSLGKFTTANMKMLKSPYQPFTFPETTARYLKFRIISAYPSDCSQLATQIRLIGKLIDTGQPPVRAAANPDDINLLAPAQGGQVIAAPDSSWTNIITGVDKDAANFSGCSGMPLETIFGFKDERPAIFSRFEMLVPYTGKFVKDFELLVADAPGGDYRSIGKFTTMNMLMVKAPYQAFTFPETTANYLKLRITSAWPSDCSQLATQVRLMGKLSEAAPAATQPAANPGEVNLLSPAEGGQMLGAPDPSWQSAVDGNDKDAGGFSCVGLPIEAVFAFKGGQAAAFSRFEILIPYTGKFVKDFELLAADDSAGGTYRSLGKFTTQNILLSKTPYQAFAFPETTAKFFKLRVLSAWPSDCTQLLTQIRLMGKPPG